MQWQQEDTVQADSRFKDGERNMMEPSNPLLINQDALISIPINIQKKNLNYYAKNTNIISMKVLEKYIENAWMPDIRVVMNLCLASGIRKEQLFPSGRLLSLIIGQPIPPCKPIIGVNAFAHESGIHQDGMLKNRQTYEIMTPQSVGRQDEDMVLGKHSGRAALVRRLEDLGYRLEAGQVDIVFAAMKKLADRKKEIFVEDLEAVILDEIFRIPDKYRLEYLSAVSGNMAIPNAVIKMYVDGEERVISDFGTGPVDAVFNTIARVVGRRPKLIRYAVNAITGGTDAQGEVTVKIEENGKTSVGRASDADIIQASAKAYLNALNRLAKKEEENACARL